ncbi:MAG: chemotaxis protein CheW [Oleiphilaceae bacterium]|nr:chemotaxis protein CheW [Oleiphilaceae bacterium]
MSRKHPFHPDSVIGSYVDDLLSTPDGWDPYLESDATPQPGPASEPARPPGVRLAERPSTRLNLISPALREIPVEQPEPEPVTPPRKQAPPEPEPAPAPAPVPPPARVEAPAATPSPSVDTEAWPQGRPPWAQNGFECLIFRVGGLQLAVPLVLLGAIHRLDSPLTELPGRPDWFMGLLREGNQTINVADTARWVMPERYRREDFGDYQFVIRLDDSQWGLACHEVAQSFRVQPEDVKWRTANSRRPWLAGTIRQQMCALLDVSRLAQMLAEAQRSRKLDINR